jgi:hypothetical protein
LLQFLRSAVLFFSSVPIAPLAAGQIARLHRLGHCTTGILFPHRVLHRLPPSPSPIEYWATAVPLERATHRLHKRRVGLLIRDEPPPVRHVGFAAA